MRWKVLLIALFAIVIAWFTLVNSTTVSVDFLVYKQSTSLVFVILISVLLGMCLMAVLWSARAWKMRRLTKSLKQQVTSLEDELAKANQELANLRPETETEAEETMGTASERPRDESPTEDAPIDPETSKSSDM